MTSITIFCIYSPDSLIESIAKAAAPDAAEMHFWALGETVDSVSEWTRGSGKGGKIELLNKLMSDEHVTHTTDYVMFLDDDIAIPPGFLPDYVRHLEALGAELAQPALVPESHHSFRATVQRPTVVARQTNWVEQQAMSMSRRLFDETRPFTIVGKGAGWGFEFTLLPALRRLNAKSAIIDACPVDHSFRPVGTDYDFRIIALKGLARLKRLGLTFEPMAVSAHCKELARGWEETAISEPAERLTKLIEKTEVPARIKALAASDKSFIQLGAHQKLLTASASLLLGDRPRPQVDEGLDPLWRAVTELIEVALLYVEDPAAVATLREDIERLGDEERMLFLVEVYGAQVFDPPVDLWPSKAKPKPPTQD